MIVERDLTRTEQALNDGSIVFAADAVRTVVDELKRLQAHASLQANEIAWLRGEIANLGQALADMPLRNNGGDLVRFQIWAVAKARHALGLPERRAGVVRGRCTRPRPAKMSGAPLGSGAG